MAVVVKIIIFSTFVFINLTYGNKADSPCGDWEAYKEEKCLKIFEGAGLLNYADAENFCKEQNESYLLSIDLEEKQKFIETFLESHSVVDNIWIGLKYVNNTYQWTDGTESQFTNWMNGSPKNNESFCVQMQTETTNFGLWSDEPCSKKNLVICEQIQLWSLVRLQTTLTNIIRNPVVPIGFIYVQLPTENPPAKTWSYMEWEDVSSDYPGLFFRTEGGEAAPFGEVQEADSPRLVAMKASWTSESESSLDEIKIFPNNEYNQILNMDGTIGGTNWDLRVKVSDGEVRPRNMAIKIWKRTK